MHSGCFARTLVTGSSGFIGGWVARTLVSRGYAVRALYRRPDMPEHLKRLREAGAEVERADLTRRPEVRSSVRGAEAVIHCAALSRDWGYRKEFVHQNLEVTRSLVEEARRAGCRVFIFFSSLSVHGFGPHRGTTEAGPYYSYFSDYQSTKKMAEELVLGHDAEGFRVTVLRPGNVYGPGDTTIFYRFLDAQEKGIRGTLGGGKRLTSVVYIEDMVEAVLLALEGEHSGGQVFNITGGEEVTWGELLGYSASLLGARPWLELPTPLAWAAAYLLNGIYRLFRLKAEPPLFPYRVAHVAWDFHFSIDKAQALLGYRPRVGWREGLRRTVEAYREFKQSGNPL